MKKKIIVLLTGILLSALVACGTGGDKTADPTKEVNTRETTEPAEKVEQSSNERMNEEDSVELPLTAMFPMIELFIDGPNYQFIEKGATNLYNVGGICFIALTSKRDVEADKPSEVLDVYFENFKFAVRTNCNGYDLMKFNIKESKEMEINGINFWRFQGDILANNTVNDKSLYTVGYTFIKDNTPFQITGVVVSEEQDQKDIDEITKYVDAMVKTIRDEW